MGKGECILCAECLSFRLQKENTENGHLGGIPLSPCQWLALLAFLGLENPMITNMQNLENQETP